MKTVSSPVLNKTCYLSDLLSARLEMTRCQLLSIEPVSVVIVDIRRRSVDVVSKSSVVQVSLFEMSSDILPGIASVSKSVKGPVELKQTTLRIPSDIYVESLMMFINQC